MTRLGTSIERGSWILLRLLDVAEELDLERIAAGARGDVHRVRAPRESSLGLDLGSMPIELEIGRRAVELGVGQSLDLAVRARVYRFGVLSIVFEAEIPGGARLADLVPIAARAWDSTVLDGLARDLAKELSGVLAPGAAPGGLYESPVIERYGMVLARAVAGDPLDDREALARVVLGEDEPHALATVTLEDALRDRYRYFEHDLAVVHASSAFVLEPDPGVDVPLALELAAAQRLELRAYDVMLDRALDRVHEALADARRTAWWLSARRHRALFRDVQEEMVGLSELVDRAESAVRVSSDLHLARVYRGALGRMHTQEVRASLARKLEIFERVHDVLASEAQAERALFVELVIVALIAVEIAMALAGIL